MGNGQDQHYHPVILQSLRRLFALRDWNSLTAYLDSLSNAHFRTAGYLIGERLLQEVTAEDFWEVASRLILWQPKAFVVTMAKAAAPRFTAGTLSVEDAGFLRLAASLRDEERWIDRQKLLMNWLPVLREPATIERLFELLGVEDPHRRVEFLLRTDGVAAGFVLLRTLRFEEHDRDFLVQTCRALMKRAADPSSNRADSLSFNIASMIRTFFDLHEVRGVFSLSIQPFELSRLDTDFETFKRLARKV